MTVSSMKPSRSTTSERTVVAIVSPVSSDDAMMVVPSMSPTTMSAVRPRRRGMLRNPILTKTRLRSASTVTAPIERARMMARPTARGPAGSPKTRSTTAA